MIDWSNMYNIHIMVLTNCPLYELVFTVHHRLLTNPNILLCFLFSFVEMFQINFQEGNQSHCYVPSAVRTKNMFSFPSMNSFSKERKTLRSAINHCAIKYEINCRYCQTPSGFSEMAERLH